MKAFRMILILLSIFLIGSLLGGCSDGNSAKTEVANIDEKAASIDGSNEDNEKNKDNENSEQENTVNPDDKLTVVATLFPQYDFAKAIAGEYADVTLLLPPGVEAHSYEPTPKDMVMLQKADVFLFTGEAMEPWTAGIIESLLEKGVKVVDLSENILLSGFEEYHDHSHDHGHSHDHDHDHEEEEHEEHEHGDIDPHYWTDPNRAITMSQNITNALIELKPEYELYFASQSDIIIKELQKLDTEIRNALEKTESKTILSGGHFAFGYFINQYGLEYSSPYQGFSPSAEPTPKKIAELIKKINSSKAKAIFYEELVDPKVAKVIADETGAQMLLLHGVHNVSKGDLESGKTYFDFMYENLENLKIGLGYNE